MAATKLVIWIELPIEYDAGEGKFVMHSRSISDDHEQGGFVDVDTLFDAAESMAAVNERVAADHRTFYNTRLGATLTALSPITIVGHPV